MLTVVEENKLWGWGSRLGISVVAYRWLFGLVWELLKPKGLADGWNNRNRGLWVTASQWGNVEVEFPLYGNGI